MNTDPYLPVSITIAMIPFPTNIKEIQEQATVIVSRNMHMSGWRVQRDRAISKMMQAVDKNNLRLAKNYREEIKRFDRLAFAITRSSLEKAR